MSITIAGHTLSRSEVRVLDTVRDYMIRHAGDSSWGATTSPKGDGREVSSRDVFADGASIRILYRLGDLGVLSACEIELNSAGMLKGIPFAVLPTA